MSNLEEKVKAFLSDEKKVEVIAHDEAFLDKIAGGTATVDDVAKKFGEVGLPLSAEEAKKLRKQRSEH